MQNFRSFVKEANKELGRVSWPDRPKVLETSLVVTACTAVFAAYLWLVDIGIYQLFRIILY